MVFYSVWCAVFLTLKKKRNWLSLPSHTEAKISSEFYSRGYNSDDHSGQQDGLSEQKTLNRGGGQCLIWSPSEGRRAWGGRILLFIQRGQKLRSLCEIWFFRCWKSRKTIYKHCKVQINRLAGLAALPAHSLCSRVDVCSPSPPVTGLYTSIRKHLSYFLTFSRGHNWFSKKKKNWPPLKSSIPIPLSQLQQQQQIRHCFSSLPLLVTGFKTKCLWIFHLWILSQNRELTFQSYYFFKYTEDLLCTKK